MAYCQRCGAKLEKDALFCPQCGATVNANNAGAAPAADFGQLGGDAVDSTNAYSAQDIAENKVLCVLCYFGILLLIPLLVKKESSFVRFHCNQGLVLLLFNIIVSVLAAVPLVGWVISIVGAVAGLVFWIMGLVNVLNGRAKTLPLIGGITIIK